MQINLDTAKKDLLRSLAKTIGSRSVIDAMQRVPREKFIPPVSRHKAYLDIALPIGEHQTISQPYMVALMIQALGLTGCEKVLEVGTGSGYQAAILSLMVPQGTVVTVERIHSLARRAETLLADLGHCNVEVRCSGPALGCLELAPFDAIIVAAAAPKLPESLVGQLAVGGRLLAPVGPRSEQQLIKASYTEGGLAFQALGLCRFVPLIGEQAFSEGSLLSGYPGIG